MKKRILSLLLVFALTLTMFPVHTFAEETSDVCPTCNEVGCILDHGTTASEDATETATEDATETATEAAACETCGTSPCTCDEVTTICLIGYLDKTNNDTISFYNPSDEEKTVAVSECPDYLILTQKTVKKSLTTDEAGNTQLVETVWYQTDSLDDTFWSNVVSSYATTEAKNFATVTSAAGLYATLGSAELTLFKDLSVATDAKTAVLTGEYVVADFCFDGTLGNWYVKLTPDESWPADAEGYVWTQASQLATLTQTPTREPAVPECTCGQEQHTSECPLYESPFSDIEDEEARAAVQAFSDMMEKYPVDLMVSYFVADQALFEEWGMIPLDSTIVPVEEQVAFDAAETALVDALATDKDNLETDLNTILVEIVTAYYDADDLLTDGVSAYFGADSQIITDYKVLEPHADMGMQTYATPDSPAPVGVNTPNIKIDLFNYGNQINSLGDLQFNTGGDYELDSASPKDSTQTDPKYNDLSTEGYPSIDGFYVNGSYVQKDIDLKPYFNKDLAESDYDSSDTTYQIRHYPVDQDKLQLFTYDPGTNKYIYDSAKNHAYYDSSNNSLIAYDYALRTYKAGHAGLAGQGSFLPFNSPASTEKEWVQTGNAFWEGEYVEVTYPFGNAIQITDGSANPITNNLSGADAANRDAINQAKQDYHNDVANLYPWVYALNGGDNRADMAFGMSMEFDFIMPKEGTINGEEMVFKFRGDDDVMVFIDGVLVLNIGGPRGMTAGSINFATGDVFVSQQYYLGEPDDSVPALGRNTNLKTIFNLAGITFEDYSKHTLTFFYMERWGGASNCYMEFNLPVLVDGEPSVAKQEVGLNPVFVGKETYTFVLRNKKDEPIPNRTYEVTKDGRTVRTGTTDTDGKFTLQNDEIATFTNSTVGEQYTVEEVTSSKYETNVKVEGAEQTQDHKTDIQTITEVGRMILFTNTWKTGDLKITKELHELGAQESTQTSFNFDITVPEGIADGSQFEYRILDASGNTVIDSSGNATRITTVSDDVMTVSLEVGQSALFENLVVGGKYTVTEQDYSSAGYSASYVDDSGTTTDGVVTIEENKTATVTCTNSFPVGSVTINKTVAKEFDGDPLGDPTFTFTLTKTDTNDPLVNDKKYKVISGDQTTEYTVTDNKIVVTLSFTDVGNKSVKIDELPTGTYQVVESTAKGFRQTYQINSGTVQTGTTASGLTVSEENYRPEVSFTNTLERHVGSLVIEKKVTDLSGAGVPDATFIFTVEPKEGVSFYKDSYEVTYTGSQATTTTENVMNGKLTLELKNGETVTIHGLSTGDYTVSEAYQLGFATYFDNSETISQSVDATVTNGSQKKVSCENQYPAYTGDLRVDKNVVTEYGKDQIPDDSFPIEVNLTPVSGAVLVNRTYTWMVYNRDGSAAAGENMSGSGTITAGSTSHTVTGISLKDGQYVEISDLPKGTYSVTETLGNLTTDYNAPTYEGESGEITVNGTAQAKITNTYKKHLGDLIISKTVTTGYSGDTWPGDTFTFTVTGSGLIDGTYNVLVGETERSVTVSNGALTISGVQLHVTALNKATTLTIFDLPIGTYQVTETADSDYTTTASGNTDMVVEAYSTPTASFTNKYTKHVGNLTVTKKVVGDNAPDAEFTFTVSGAALDRDSYMVSINGGTETACTVSADKTLTLKLKNGDTAVIKDLDLAQYHVVEKGDSRFVLTTYNGENGTIQADDSAKAEFINTYVPRGNLKVTKFVENEFEGDVIPDDQKTFTFTVTLLADDPGSKVYAYKKYSVGNNIASPEDDTLIQGDTIAADPNSDGNLTLEFTLENGQYIVIDGLPAGSYQISETYGSAFNDPKFEDGTGSIPTDGTESVTCINTLTRTKGTLKITKQVVNNVGTIDIDEFQFTVELTPSSNLTEVAIQYTDADGNKVWDNETVSVVNGTFNLTLKDGWTAIIANIPASAYTVTEASYPNVVTTWGEGGNTGIISGGNTAEVRCINTYTADKGNLKISKTVEKEFADDVLPANEEFTVQVDFENNGTSVEGAFDYKVFSKNADPETATPVSTGTITSGSVLVLKDGQFAIIYDIPPCSFDVTETRATSGLVNYDVSYAHPEGHSIVAGKTVVSNITNTYQRRELTIAKNLADMNEKDGQQFIFHIRDDQNKTVMSVTMGAGESKTICNLPAGTYTVVEDTAWSWRYVLTKISINGVDTPEGTQIAKVNLSNSPTASVAFTNDRTENKWLNHFNSVLNMFPNNS